MSIGEKTRNSAQGDLDSREDRTNHDRIANDAEVEAVSALLISQNRQAYKALAK